MQEGRTGGGAKGKELKINQLKGNSPLSGQTQNVFMTDGLSSSFGYLSGLKCLEFYANLKSFGFSKVNPIPSIAFASDSDQTCKPCSHLS